MATKPSQMSVNPRRVRSLVGRYARELALWPSVVRKRSGKRIAFFPDSGREQSGLLRIYNIAEQLENWGWTTLVCPKHLSLRQRRRIVMWFRPEISVVQSCRHPLNRAENFRNVPFVFEFDDADFFDSALTKPMADMASAAQGVVCGSRFLENWARDYNENTEVIWTGTPVTPGPWPEHTDRDPIVTWAQSDPVGYHREFEFITDVLCAVRKTTSQFTLRLYGWSGPQAHPQIERLKEAGIDLDIRGFLPYNEFLATLREAAVGLSPIITSTEFNKGKSFGKILGYLDGKVPVICSDEADHSLFFDNQNGVVSNSKPVWVNAVSSLLSDPAKRQQMADKAHQDFQNQLTLPVAAKHVEKFLNRVLVESRS